MSIQAETPKYVATTPAVKRYGISRMTLHRLRDRDDFPKPVALAGKNLWPVDELDAWFEAQRG